MFLKRMACADVTMDKLFLGGIVTVFSRQLKLTDYGDAFTRGCFAKAKESTFAMIKPDSYVHTGKIIDHIYKSGLMLTRLKMGRFTAATTARFLQQNDCQSAEASQLLQSDVSTGMEVVGDDACAKMSVCAEALQKQFGANAVRNAVHASKDAAAKKADLDLFFNNEIATSAIFNNCTCVVIKPHVVASGQAGEVVHAILEEGFEISAMQMFHLDKPTAEEFLEIYRGVLPEYIPTTEQMTTGPCIVMEVRQENAVMAFRQLCGPMDPEIAKNLRPNTLRARFGCDRVKNAVHCTDLPEDGVLESQYFFQIQQ